jgi:hypothetical protein
MTVEVSLTTFDPTPTAVVAAATNWSEFASLWKPMLDKVWALLTNAPEGLRKDGHNVMLYKDDRPNVEVGVQVNRPFEAVGDVVPSTLPGGLAAMARHTGPITTIGETHDAVRAWCTAHGHAMSGARWEIYGDPGPEGQLPVDVFWAISPPHDDE